MFAAEARRGSRADARPTSPSCSRPARSTGARCSRATSRCWCAPTTRARWCTPRCAASGCRRCSSGTASVFGTPVAREWLQLLEALRAAAGGAAARRGAHLLPRAHRRASCAGPTPTSCSTASACACGRGRALLRERGVAALLEAVTTDTGLPERLLRADRRRAHPHRPAPRRPGPARGGRRRAPRARPRSSTGCATASGRPTPGSRAEVGTERSRRLESDAAAVQIITVHRSKGLEFPVVYVPFAGTATCAIPRCRCCTTRAARGCSTSAAPPARGSATTRPRTGSRRPARTCGCSTSRSPGPAARSSRGGCPTTTTSTSPLHRLLFGRPAPGTRARAERTRSPPTTPRCIALRALESPVARRSSRWRRRPAAVTRACARIARHPCWSRSFDRELDPRWRRTSYSALTAGVDHAPAGVASEADAHGTDDEPGVDARAGRADPATSPTSRCRRRPAAPRLAMPSPMARAADGRRRSARSCTRCSRRPTSPRPTSPPSCPRTRHAQLARHPVAGLEPGGAGRGAAPVDAARRSARSPTGCGWPTSPRATGSPSSTSSCRWPAATTPSGPSR